MGVRWRVSGTALPGGSRTERGADDVHGGCPPDCVSGVARGSARAAAVRHQQPRSAAVPAECALADRGQDSFGVLLAGGAHGTRRFCRQPRPVPVRTEPDARHRRRRASACGCPRQRDERVSRDECGGVAIQAARGVGGRRRRRRSDRGCGKKECRRRIARGAGFRAASRDCARGRPVRLRQRCCRSPGCSPLARRSGTCSS